MAQEKTPTWQRPKKILPPTGPLGLPKEGQDPTRPVTRNGVEGTNSRTIERPAQGNFTGQDMSIPTPNNDAYGR